MNLGLRSATRLLSVTCRVGRIALCCSPVALTPEVAQRILTALQAKVALFPPCWVCQNKTWGLSDGFVMQILQSRFDGSVALQGRSQPST